MLSVVTWKWKGTRPYEAIHVNTLRRMVAEHYPEPHRFICVTDDASGLHEDIEVVPLPEFEHLPVKSGYPSCYVRLWAFSKEARDALGERIVNLDLDIVIVGDLRPLFNAPGEFVAWSDASNEKFKYQGGFYIMDTGTRSYVWDDFKGVESQAITQAAGLIGSDQAWMSYVMDNEATVNKSNGIWKLSDFHRSGYPYDKANMIQLNGSFKPWGGTIKQRHPTIYRDWKAASIRSKGHDVYINNRSYHDGRQMQVRGEINESPSASDIARNFVREIKVVAPEVTKPTQAPETAQPVEPETKPDQPEVKHVKRRRKRKQSDATE